MIRICIITILGLLSVFPAVSQISVDTNRSVRELIEKDFLRGGVEVGNISFLGNRKGLGLFRSASDLFPLDKGIFLSTGYATDIIGPNNQMGISGQNHSSGDTILSMICRDYTYDATIIGFDFTATSENLAFDYVFASEEYPEYVNTSFNDVFAFIIIDPETREQLNIAFLPRTHQPITVNNVNHLKNTGYYIDNPTPVSNIHLLQQRLNAASNPSGKKKKKEEGYVVDILPCKSPLCSMVQYDGFTRVLTAKAKVVPGKRYYFKIAIADVHDDIYDSGVILKAHSFKSYDKYGYIKGDTSGYRVLDEDLTAELSREEKRPVETKYSTAFTVLFDFDSYRLSDSAARVLTEVAALMNKDPELKLNLKAHTDSIGSFRYNELLSEKRNAAVKQMLLQSGIPLSRISLARFGETAPVADNANSNGRALNRRVELYIEK